VADPFTIVIGDTGMRSSTAEVVGELRRQWLNDPTRYEAIFDEAGQIVLAARGLIESGRPAELGPLMDHNQRLLQEMGVSSVELERLASAARAAGALGAKLSGGGRGGNMIALVEDDAAAPVASALETAGATRTLITTVQPSEPNS
jgi:mevalonate kinase